MASTVENRLTDEEYDEDDEGLPAISFLPRVVRTQLQRSTSGTASSHNGVASPAERVVLQASRPVSEQQQQPIYVVEEESNY